MSPQVLFMGMMVSIIMIIFFAGMEISFLYANKLNLELKKQQGTFSGKIIGKFLNKPYEAVGTTVTGFTIGMVIYSLCISLLMSPFIDTLFQSLAIKNEVIVAILSILINVVLATVIILVIAELLPKAFFKRRANKVLTLFAWPFNIMYNILYPICKLNVEVAEFMLKYLFNVRIQPNKEPFQKLDLENFVNYSLHGSLGLNDAMRQRFFEHTLRLLKVRVRQCMVPRNEIIAIDKAADVTTVKDLFLSTQLSRILVYDGTIDHIIGYLHYLDWVRYDNNLQALIHPISAIPESMNVLALMESLNKEKKNIAWVVDEYGGTSGIITMENILEEIFGDIQDEYDAESLVAKKLSDNVYLFSGRLHMDYIQEHFGLKFPNDMGAETLSGYIVQHIGRIPKLQERVIIGNFEFEPLLVTNTRVATVKVKSLG